MDKQHIIDEIRRTAAANGGVALGRERFARETAIREGVWRGIHWTRWADALGEAGFDPQAGAMVPDTDSILAQLAALVRRLGRFPTLAELRAERGANPAFPSGGAFERLGSKVEIIDRLRAFCRATSGYDDVPGILDFSLRAARADPAPVVDPTADDGYVHLVQSGKHFRFVAVQSLDKPVASTTLAEDGRPVHSVRTDDPAGIQKYWQDRCAARKTRGDWFALAPEDVAAFKRRKFM